MAFAETAQLVAVLNLKDSFSGPLKNASKTLSGFDAKLGQVSTRAFKAGQQIGTGIRNGAKIAAIGLGLLATQVIAGINQLAKLEGVTNASNAVLKSTRAVAGQTAASIRALAEKYENLNATIDDKVIQSGENLLLTFTNIRKEAFEPALLAALNLNTAMGGGEGGLQKTLIQVGKALNDPSKGFTALKRVGVAFTDQQIKQIKALQKSGDLLGAQRIILRELGTEFGGQFAAAGKGATATIASIGDAVEDLQKALATALFPTVQKVLPRIRDLLISPQFLAGVDSLGTKIANLFSDKNINEGARILEGLFNTAKSVAPAIQHAAEVTGAVVGKAVELFRSLPPELKTLLVAGLAINKLTGGLVTNIAGGLISAVLKSLVSAVVNIQAANVNVVGAGGGGDLVGKGITVAGLAAIAVSVAAAAGIVLVGGAVANNIDPTAVGPGRETLFNRDPRRFGPNGQVVRNSVPIPVKVVGSGTQGIAFGGHEPEAIPKAASALQRAAAKLVSAADALKQAKIDLPGVLKGIRARSAAKFGGKGLGENAVDATFNRDLRRLADNVSKGGGNVERRLNRLNQLAALADAHGGTRSRATAAAIRRQQAVLKASIDRQKTKVTVNVTTAVKTNINGRQIQSNIDRYSSTVLGSGLSPGQK